MALESVSVSRAAVILAPGFEEVEALTPVDLLRRAGIEVTVYGLGSLDIKGSRGVTVHCDQILSDQTGLADALVLPGGGGGSKALAASPLVSRFILAHHDQGRVVGAICAAPAVVLHPLGLLKGRHFTCFPGCEEGLRDGTFHPLPCVRSGQLITAQAVGSAADFALALIAALQGPAKALEIHRQTVQIHPEPRCQVLD